MKSCPCRKTIGIVGPLLIRKAANPSDSRANISLGEFGLLFKKKDVPDCVVKIWPLLIHPPPTGCISIIGPYALSLTKIETGVGIILVCRCLDGAGLRIKQIVSIIAWLDHFQANRAVPGMSVQQLQRLLRNRRYHHNRDRAQIDLGQFVDQNRASTVFWLRPV